MAQTLRAQQLPAFLKRAAALPGLFVLTGDEPLLQIEAADGIRAAAHARGHTERLSLVLDARSDWSQLLAETQSISLFGDRKLLDIKLPSGKPGKTGGEALQKLAQQLPPEADDLVAVLTLPRLDRATRNSAWMSALAEHGVVVEIPTIDRPALPGWISERLARQEQQADPDLLQWLADRVEGNLLAAHQEIQKLALLCPAGKLNPEAVHEAVMNVARYDVFKLRDAMLQGDAARVVRMIDGLKAEGEALPLLLWAIGEEIRVLARLAALKAQGQTITPLFKRLRIFGQHEQYAQDALQRLPPKAWAAALHHAHEVDKLIKGLRVAGRLPDAWHELTRLALRLC